MEARLTTIREIKRLSVRARPRSDVFFCPFETFFSHLLRDLHFSCLLFFIYSHREPRTGDMLFLVECLDVRINTFGARIPSCARTPADHQHRPSNDISTYVRLTRGAYTTHRELLDDLPQPRMFRKQTTIHDGGPFRAPAPPLKPQPGRHSSCSLTFLPRQNDATAQRMRNEKPEKRERKSK